MAGASAKIAAVAGAPAAKSRGETGSRCKAGTAPATVNGRQKAARHWSAPALREGCQPNQPMSPETGLRQVRPARIRAAAGCIHRLRGRRLPEILMKTLACCALALAPAFV